MLDYSNERLTFCANSLLHEPLRPRAGCNEDVFRIWKYYASEPGLGLRTESNPSFTICSP